MVLSSSVANRAYELLKNLVFMVAIVTVFFGAVELVLAALGIEPLIVTDDPLVGFAENVPQFVEAHSADGTEIMRTAQNKRIMFNYQEFPKRKSDNSYRIFCMGGSTTYGRPYFDEVSFCGWLRVYLKAADPTRNWEVINAGGVSYASYRVARLMNELKDYQPDLFIVYSGQNEFLEQRSYGRLMKLPPWVINLDATLSGTRTYTVLKKAIEPLLPESISDAQQLYQMTGEVEEVLNHTIGPQSYHRDDTLKQQIMIHYRLNLIRMVKIARSVGADILFVQPAINLKDMSPFKSEHREGLDPQALKRWDALYQRGIALDASGKTKEALQMYQQALDIDDRYADLHYRIGQDLFKRKRYDEAQQAFQRAVEEDVAPLRILKPMQRIVEEVAAQEQVPLVDFPAILRQAYLSKYDYAVFGKEFFRDHVHTNIEGYRLLGLALFNELAAEGVVKPESSWNTARRKAVEKEQMANLDPMLEGKAMLNLGKVFDWAGKFEEAYDAYQWALTILGPSPMLYDSLATCSFILKKYDDTLYYLDQTLARYPEIAGTRYRRAIALGMQGKTDEAIEECKQELAAHPGNENVHYALGNLYADKGETAAAIEEFQTTLRLKPADILARMKLATLLIEQERYDEALPYVQEVLRSDPKEDHAHTALGLILKHQGKTAEAIAQFSEALRLEPGNKIARDNLEQLHADRGAKEGTGTP
jgi:tetratricopeptide (TPR) repeat protein